MSNMDFEKTTRFLVAFGIALVVVRVPFEVRLPEGAPLTAKLIVGAWPCLVVACAGGFLILRSRLHPLLAAYAAGLATFVGYYAVAAIYFHSDGRLYINGDFDFYEDVLYNYLTREAGLFIHVLMGAFVGLCLAGGDLLVSRLISRASKPFRADGHLEAAN